MSRTHTFRQAHSCTASDDSILLQIRDSIPRIETELKHLKELAEATKKDVEGLKTWKALILGGAASMGILFGLYQATMGSVHVMFGNTPSMVVAPHAPSSVP